MNKAILIIAIVLIVVVAGVFILIGIGQAQARQGNGEFITAVPVNLSQISAISKFRSCIGHDYSGLDVNGSQETNRSMKHYFVPKQQYAGSTGEIQEFAPFNGTVSQITKEQTTGSQVWIADSSGLANIGGLPMPGTWNFVFFHMNPMPGLKVGSKVTAGELMGYANQSNNEQSFDLGLSEFTFTHGKGGQVLDSIFNHMTPQVLAKFAVYGVNQSDIVIPKAYRDANPCQFSNYPYFVGPPSPDNWVNMS